MFLSRWSPPARLLARDENAVSLCGVATVPVYLGIGPREYFGGELQLPADFRWDAPLTSNSLGWLRRTGVTHKLSFTPIADDGLALLWSGYDPFLHALLGRPADQPLWLYLIHGTRNRCYWFPASQELEKGEASDSLQFKVATKVTESANAVAIAVDCDEPAIVVLTDLAYPGWEVRVDGMSAKPLEGTDFRAVRVEAGSHEIEWTYRPFSLRIGWATSIFALLASVMLFLKPEIGKVLIQRRVR
jgi:hypothetical protein